MRRLVGVFMPMLLLVLAADARAADSPASPKPARERGAVEDGWPDTPAGRVGWRWVQAFNHGADAMRTLYEEHLAASSAAERSIDARIDRYRELRSQFGKLTFASVSRSDSAEVAVKLLDADLAEHTFIFRAETRSPWKLVSVGMEQKMNVGHGGFHH